MLLRNKPARALIFAVFAGIILLPGAWSRPQNPAPQQTKPQPQPTPLPPDVDPSDPALPVWARPATPAPTTTPPTAPPANIPPATPPPAAPQQPAAQPQKAPDNVGQVTTRAGGFVYRTQTEEVTLQATVVDQKQNLVTTLKQENFSVFEDDRPQKILSFRREDIPVSIGIIVDNSGSMRKKRQAVTQAVLNLIKASNPQDEVFIVNFNDNPYLDQDFTNDISLLKEALDRVDSRGGTALYDALMASADQLAKNAKREKKVLLVVTDGEDTASTHSLEEAIRAVQNDKGPMIYSIGILDEEGRRRTARRALNALSLQTGGIAYFPKTLEEVNAISQEVAHDIRNQYSLTYKPSNPQSAGGYRKVRVVARAAGMKNLQVRTRSGYFAGGQKKADLGH